MMRALTRRYGIRRWHCVITACFAFIGCTPTPPLFTEPLPEKFQQSNLPEPDITLNIPGLGPCDNSADRSLRLNSQEPVTVLVHGCYGSAGSFRTLSKVLAFHGQQTACFTYDDRDSLMLSSSHLNTSLEALTAQLPKPEITVIGHSQGGLISRKALVTERADPIKTDARLELVTVSAPFSGIRASRICANPVVRVLTMGLHDLLCKALSGDKWYEITPASDFIKSPGTLQNAVDRYLLVTTDEENSCRQYDEQGQCVQDDYVFGLDEQVLPPVPSGTLATQVEIRAGHVEVVGETGIVPQKLIDVLQQQGYMRSTEPSRAAELRALLAYWYGAETNRRNKQ